MAYDIVYNGIKIKGGSLIVGAGNNCDYVLFGRRKNGVFLKALNFGAPLHGGIAYGIDQLVMVLAIEISIKYVIAFPKTTRTSSRVDPKQLQELS